MSPLGLVDAVVVHYGDPAPTRAALARLARLGCASLTVVDNAGNLGAPAGARTIDPGRNLGFGAGANLGAAAGAASWILVLNPDLEIGGADVTALVIAGERNPALAAVAPRLTHPDGSPQINGGRFSGLSRELGRATGLGTRLRRLRAAVRREARGAGAGAATAGPPVRRDWVSGAAICLRREAFAAVGGFDERFFLYYEDEDLARRLRARGGRAAVVPGAHAVHAVGGCATGTDPYRSPAFAASRALYHRIHSGPLVRALAAR